MANELKIVDKQNLSAQEIEELDAKIDSIIERHKNNRAEINRLVLEGTTALTAGDKLSQDMNSQKRLKRFWKRFSGKNNQTQNEINADIFKAQYAAQETLQKLTEQNLLSFELIAVVNNRLNASMLEVNEEIIGIKSAMVEFFSAAKEKLIDHEERISRLEHKDKLQDWTINIRNKTFDGVKYKDLDDVTKIVCLVRDFLDLTGDDRQADDFIHLETAIENVGLNGESKIDGKKFIRQVGGNNELYNHLLGGDPNLDEFATEDEEIIFEMREVKLGADKKFSEDEIPIESSQKESFKTIGFKLALTAVSSLFKSNDPNAKAMASATRNFFRNAGVESSPEEIISRLQKNFFAENFSAENATGGANFNFALELIYNLEQIQYAKEFHLKQKQAEELFLNCKIEEVWDLLCELDDADDVRARYIFAIIYNEGLAVDKDHEFTRELLEANISEGDVCSIYFGKRLGLVSDVEIYFDAIKNFADNGDVFAQYELAQYYSAIENNELSLKYLEQSAAQKFFLAIYELGEKCYSGKDYLKAKKYFEQSATMGHGCSMLFLGNIYWYGYGVEIDKEKSVEWYKKAYNDYWFNDNFAISVFKYEILERIGIFYREQENFSEALRYLELLAIVSTDGRAECFLGDIFWEGGNGLSINEIKAVEWYKKAYEKGYSSDDLINRIGLYYTNVVLRLELNYFDTSEPFYLKAVKWWRIGEGKNYPQCLANLGWAYRCGKGIGNFWGDCDKAIEYFKRAIEAGSKSGYPERNIGELYFRGEGCFTAHLSEAEKNLKLLSRAKPWFEKAADKGDEIAKKWLAEYA